MSLFAYLMANDVTLERRTGTDSYGTPQYAPEEQIIGRIACERHEIVDAQGQRTSSDATLYTVVRVATGDLVSGGNVIRSPVKAVYERQGLFGETDHWEARL